MIHPKSLIFILALIGLTGISGFTGNRITSIWSTDFEAAIAASEESGLPVLVVFSGSDWCKPCMLLRQTVLDTPEFASFAENHLILLEVDFPRTVKNKLTAEQMDHNEKLAERFNPKGLFPLVLLLNTGQEILGKTHEQPNDPQEFIAALKSWMPEK